jgi:hypothetical protein
VQDFELFDRWRAVMDELQRRELIRSVNRPLIGDYAETLVARALGATRPSGPDRGTDLVTADGRTVQVKARRDPASGQATHFDISNLDKPRFDLFVGVHFAEDFGVQGAWVLGAEKVVELAGVSGRRVLIRDIERAAASGGPGVTLLEL